MLRAHEPLVLRRANVERLLRFDGHGARVLSVYLDLGSERSVTRSYGLVLEHLVKAARDGLDKHARRDLEAEVSRVREWLGTERPRARGLAVFSSSAAGLWATYPLPVAVPDRLSFEIRPLITPLLGSIQDLRPYVVALVDKESARLLMVSEARIESVEVLTDDVPGRHEQGGSAQTRLQRHHEDHVVRHVKRVVERLSEVLRLSAFDRLILGGPDEALALVCARLPRELARRLVATIPAGMFATDAEILAMTLAVERRADREREAVLAAEAIQASQSTGSGACGLSATLETIWLRQTASLVLADGLVASGSECPVDGRLYPDPPGPCPMCGAETLPVADVVDRAAQLTLEQHGDVEVVHEGAARRLRDACEGMGALLRFRLHA